MDEPLRILFFGTPEFALPALRALHASRHEVVGVVSQPDRPRGRGRQTEPTPVRALAEELGLPLLQPEKVGDPEALAWMRERGADLGVVIAFGQFIPRSVRELPPRRLINAHGSLLPRWRGAAPIEWAIRAGDTHTGVSIMYVEKGMDSGDVCLTRETAIGPEETAGELRERLAAISAGALVEACDAIAAGTARFVAQDPAGVTEAPKLDRAFAALDWSRPAAELLAVIRAASPRPGADLALRRSRRTLRILRARMANPASARSVEGSVPGSVRAADGHLRVRAADAWIDITELQPQGKRPQSAAEFLRGARLPDDEEVVHP